MTTGCDVEATTTTVTITGPLCDTTPSSSPPPPPPPSPTTTPENGRYVRIDGESMELRAGANFYWVVFDEKDGVVIDPCCASPLATQTFSPVDAKNLGIPDVTLSFDLPIQTGCAYIPDTSGQPGALSCPDFHNTLPCRTADEFGTVDCHGLGDCAAASTYDPSVLCEY